LILFLLFGISFGIPSIEPIQTSKYTNDRLIRKPSISFTNGPPLKNVLSINPNVTFQTLLGFGGAMTESSGYVLSRMNEDLQKELINAFFGSEGNSYSMARVHINSCDFSLASYSFDDVAGDYDLKHFDISHDKKYLIPFIQKALSVSPYPFRLYASPWSPPAWMKSNGEMDHSGYPGLIADPQIHKAWALYFTKFIEAYRSFGIDIWGITVQNEPGWSPPWEGCYYNASEERDFVRDYLGPIMRQNEPNVKIMICDDQKSNVFEWAKIILGDLETAQYVWGSGFHWYDGDYFDHLEETHQMFPNKGLLATEACDCPAQLGDWNSGEHYAHDIVGDLNHWALGWVHWNMFLNRTGGPNHLGNDCDAPILADMQNQILYYQPSYFYMGHFSRFLPPDSVRIQLNSTSSILETVGFITPKEDVVIVVLNRSNGNHTFSLQHGSYFANYEIPSHSIQTFVYQNF